MKKSAITLFSALLLSAALPVAAHAAAFALQEQGPSALGASISGSVANPKDGSTMFFNPAGMTMLDGPQAQIDVGVIIPTLDFTDRGSTVTTPATIIGFGGAVASGGGNGGDPFDPVVVGSTYLATPFNSSGNFWGGIAVTVPYGLAIDYGRNWVGRYDSTKSELTVIDIAPTVAFKLGDKVSIGLGVDFQQADADLESALPDPTSAAPSAATDGSLDLEGDDWTTGFNAGIMFEPTERLRIGANYRSATTPDLDGRLVTTAPVGVGGAVTSQNASAELKLPDQASIGFAYDLNDRWTIMARGTWFGWDRFNEIRVKFSDGTADLVTATNYDDSYAVAAGAEYRHSESLTLRGGVQFDETPTRDGFRSTSVPDADRFWISGGGNYAFNDKVSLDLSASHLFVKDEDINLTGATARNFAALGSAATVVGSTESSVNIFAATLKYKF